jgi:hypothetical protein
MRLRAKEPSVIASPLPFAIAESSGQTARACQSGRGAQRG